MIYTHGIYPAKVVCIHVAGSNLSSLQMLVTILWGSPQKLIQTISGQSIHKHPGQMQVFCKHNTSQMQIICKHLAGSSRGGLHKHSWASLGQSGQRITKWRECFEMSLEQLQGRPQSENYTGTNIYSTQYTLFSFIRTMIIRTPSPRFGKNLKNILRLKSPLFCNCSEARNTLFQQKIYIVSFFSNFQAKNERTHDSFG